MEQIGLEAVLKDSNFQNGIKKYQSSVDTANTKTSKFSGALNNLTSGVPILGQAMTLLTNPISLVVGGLGAFAAVAKKSITEFVDYNKQIREMAQATGITAEETSRIVQVADDWGVSIESVRSALALMNKNGIAPSIENLADLADEYVNTEDKTKFAEKASKLLGRQYMTLIPLFAKGGDALREQTDAVDDNLIATEESIAMSREYEIQMDNLGDTVTGLKNRLAKELLPAVNDVTSAFNDYTVSTLDFIDVSDRYYELIKLGLITEEERIANHEAMVEVGGRTAEVNDIMAASIENYNQKLGFAKDGADEGRNAFVALMGSTVDFTEATDEMAKAAEEAAKVLQTQLKTELNDLQSLINGKLGPEMDDFNEKQADLTQKMVDTQAEIDRLIADGYGPMSEEVLGLKSDYGELKGQYDENAVAHDEATQRILFDILTQQAAVDGLTTAEVGFLTTIATNWGLIDQETAEATLRAQEAMDYVNRSGDFEGAERIINGQATTWSLAKEQAALAKGQVMGYSDALDKLDGKTVTTYIRLIRSEEGELSPGRQHGGPVSAGFPYLVGEAGPELFRPSMSGMIIPNSAISNYSVSTNNSRSVNVNMGNIHISNGASHQAFISQVEFAVQRALGV